MILRCSVRPPTTLLPQKGDPAGGRRPPAWFLVTSRPPEGVEGWQQLVRSTKKENFVGTPISYSDVIAHKVAGAPDVGGVGADLRALLTRTWRDAADYQRFVYKVASVLVMTGMFHGLVWAVLGGSLTETVSWRKPTFFLASAGLSIGICAFVMSFLRITRRQGWQLGMGLVIPASTVGVLVSLQQWRGTRSHFNFFESTFDTTVAGIIPFIISLLVPTVAVLGVLTLRALPPQA